MPLLLEDFEVAQSPEPAVAPSEAVPRIQAEAEKVARYEQGYQAGWDDATKAEAQEQSRIGADFARNLQDLSFTFHEARSQILQGMQPLLDEMMGTLLPELVQETMGLRIIEELKPMIEDCADRPIELIVGPQSMQALEKQLANANLSAMSMIAEPSLAEGQAYLRVGKAELQIDMAGALEQISDAIGSLYAFNERTEKHG